MIFDEIDSSIIEGFELLVGEKKLFPFGLRLLSPMNLNWACLLIVCFEDTFDFYVELLREMDFLQVHLLDRVINRFRMVAAEVLLEIEQVLTVEEDAGRLLELSDLIFVKVLV